MLLKVCLKYTFKKALLIKIILELKYDDIYAIKLTSSDREPINNYLEKYIDKINNI